MCGRRSVAFLCVALSFLSACATSTPTPTRTAIYAPRAAPRLPERDLRINYEETILFGDSAHALTDDRITGFKVLTGKAPTYWGRYICNNNSDYDLSSSELDVFRRSGIKPILILQPGQSTLSGGQAEAVEAARCFKAKLDALASEFLFPGDLMIFLDVEKGTHLSQAYLEALVSELQASGVLAGSTQFGLYLSGGYSSDVRALINSEVANRTPISVVWIARYLKSCGPLPYWQDNNIPELGSINVSSELWQYAEACHAYGMAASASFDLDAVKPPVYAW